MALLELPSLLRTIVSTAVLYAIYHLHWQLTVGASRRQIIKKYGCEPAKAIGGRLAPLYLLLGWGVFKEDILAYKGHWALELGRSRFVRLGNTLILKLVNTQVIMTVEPENLKTIMATNFKDWNLTDTRKLSFAPLLGDGIFTLDGAAWQHSRDLLRPNFVRSQVGDLRTFERHVNHLLYAIPRDGSTVDLQELFFLLTMDSATEFLFGKSTDCLAPGAANDSNRRFAVAFNRSQEYVGQGGRSLWKGPFRYLEFRRDTKFVHTFVDYYVQRALAYRKSHNDEKLEGERYVFLHELAKRTDDPVRIRSELINVLVAGRDTTASLLSNTFFTLARRPDIWTKLRKEVDQLNGKQPTFEQIKEMKYLRYVLNECEISFHSIPNLSKLILH